MNAKATRLLIRHPTNNWWKVILSRLKSGLLKKQTREHQAANKSTTQTKGRIEWRRFRSRQTSKSFIYHIKRPVIQLYSYNVILLLIVVVINVIPWTVRESFWQKKKRVPFAQHMLLCSVSFRRKGENVNVLSEQQKFVFWQSIWENCQSILSFSIINNHLSGFLSFMGSPFASATFLSAVLPADIENLKIPILIVEKYWKLWLSKKKLWPNSKVQRNFSRLYTDIMQTLDCGNKSKGEIIWLLFFDKNSIDTV